MGLNRIRPIGCGGPGDGKALWCKSGQVSMRDGPLTLVTAPVELLYAATLGGMGAGPGGGGSAGVAGD